LKRLIYQVAVGTPSKLYKHCIESVSNYCEKYNISHIVQRSPKLWIKPDPFTTNRSAEAVSRVGCLPIFEKENAFEYLKSFDQIGIIDADIYIRGDADNCFDKFGVDHAFGAVVEREMDIQPWYQQKIINYSRMQYSQLHNNKVDFKPNYMGFEFFNMGMILLNSALFEPHLKNQTPKQFIEQSEFKDFVDGKGPWKWSTDQTLLNYFVKKHKVSVKHMDPVWNGLYLAVNNIHDCHFVHFFLKDKLPERGENVGQLMESVNG
jgi:hypothetical protein